MKAARRTGRTTATAGTTASVVPAPCSPPSRLPACYLLLLLAIYRKIDPMSFDLVIRGGAVVTAEKTLRADIGIQGEKIAAIGTSLSGKTILDAGGKLVMPGGVDSHCHVEQLSSMGKMCADDFYSATVAAAFGGTTTIIPFAAQHRGNSIVAVVDDYAKRAAEKAVIDYGFHLIIADPTPHALDEELPQMVRRGITSFKVYMTYA